MRSAHEPLHRAILYLSILALTATDAAADLLIYEGFDFTVGERVIGQTNPSSNQAWSDPTAPAQPGDGVDTQLIAADSLSYAGLSAPTGNSLSNPANIQSNIARIDLPNRPYTYDGGVQSLFFSFVMNLNNWKTIEDSIAASTNHQNGDFVAGFTASIGGMSGANVYAGQFRIRREVVDGVQTGRYQLGIHKNNLSGGVADWDLSQSYAVGDSILVAGEYQFGTVDTFDDVVRLWVNPTPGETPAAPNVESTAGYDVSTAGGAAQGNINSFWFRSGATFQPGDLIFDELRIGTTFADVVPAGSAGAAGDFNNDGVVDGADFLVWQRGESPAALSAGDLGDWQANFGTSPPSAVSAVPEPSGPILALLASLGWVRRAVQRSCVQR